ncbi:hypothetical protein [Pedobacter nyackensis]|uniref:Uncharacterized protein n=1 Tax=Pedobacter nyackensis TaxID=475255 RepID=A0A1W2C6V3_9SPHI|nr:hypothetical protein [Pedobacter nyackensis]SMC80418.1 hypothetical protein SAMN04488101_103151 [Pedobacter nyackensis]
MNYKKLLILSLMLCIGLAGKTQEIIRTNFMIEDYKKGIQEIELTFNNFIIGIDPEGKICFVEPLKRSVPNYWDDFEDNAVNGGKKIGDLDVTYYDNFDSAKSGKIKSIDGIPFDYYSNFDIHDKKGRLKSIGKIAFKYNNNFDIHDINGTLKSIGNIDIKYNNSFDIHDSKGTLKSVGPIKISWYNTFDNDALRGKIKSIRGNTRALHVTRVNNNSNP